MLNRTVCVDFIYLDGKSVFHVFDKDTKFNAACFLKCISTESIWEVIMSIWASPYVGYLDEISVDQGPQFKSLEWQHLLQVIYIKESSSGIEIHNAIRVRERVHAYLRRVYNKVRAGNSALSTPYAPQLAVKATKDTAGPSGLVPTIFIFGFMPRVPLMPNYLPTNSNIIRAMLDARREMAKISNMTIVKTAATSNVPGAADLEYQIGDEVMMFREKPISKLLGPYII